MFDNLLFLSLADIIQLGGDKSDLYIQAVEHALALHTQGETVQPLKPYLRPSGEEGHIADRIIAMPAYLGGEDAIAGLKWIGSKHDNPAKRGIARASALIILNDSESYYPVAIMEGSLISAMRTAAVTALASRYLARPDFERLTCIGCGVIGRTQVRTLLEQFSSIQTVHLFDIDAAASRQMSLEIKELFPHIICRVETSARSAVEKGEVVITSTVTSTPYIHYDWLSKGTFISNISIMDVHPDVFVMADKVVVDDWEQSNREKKVIHQLVLEGAFSRQQLYAELGEITTGHKAGRVAADEIILLNPMGLAIEDLACAQEVYRRACSAGIGTWLSLR